MLNNRFKLRVAYKKVDQAGWISHLELLRTIEHIVRRSGLPFAVSNGFSPHMKISFSQALGVGIESNKQFFDIVLTKYIKPDKCLQSLIDASMPCLEPYDCFYVDNHDTLAQKVGDITQFVALLDKKIDTIDIPKELHIIRKGKEKTLNVDEFLVDGVSLDNSGKYSELSFKIKFSENGSMKPEVFLRALLDKVPGETPKIKKIKII